MNRPSENAKKMESSVYVLHFPEFNAVKIGKANRVSARIKQLRKHWGRINTADSYQFKFGSEKEAFDVESRMKSHFSRQKKIMPKNADGYTEFYQERIVKAAVEMLTLESTPGGSLLSANRQSAKFLVSWVLLSLAFVANVMIFHDLFQWHQYAQDTGKTGELVSQARRFAVEVLPYIFALVYVVFLLIANDLSLNIKDRVSARIPLFFAVGLSVLSEPTKLIEDLAEGLLTTDLAILGLSKITITIALQFTMLVFGRQIQRNLAAGFGPHHVKNDKRG